MRKTGLTRLSTKLVITCRSNVVIGIHIQFFPFLKKGKWGFWILFLYATWLIAQLTIICSIDRIFGGQYGSALENRLEQELEDLEDKRGRILEANFKWRQAQMMFEYACMQLSVAISKWQGLKDLPPE